MASGLYPSLVSALNDMLGVQGQTFLWEGVPYTCVLNPEHNTFTTSKAQFGAYGYPNTGDTIRIANENFQIKGIANATLEYVPGGLAAGGESFVDDPNNPALLVEFGTYIKG